MPPPVQRPLRGVTAPVRSSPDPHPLYRVTYGDVFKELPKDRPKTITELPDFTYDLDSTKLSDTTEYSARYIELVLADDGEAPSLRASHKLIRELIPGVKQLFQRLAYLLKRTMGESHRLTTQELREYDTLADHAKGAMLVMQEIQYTKYKVLLANH